MSFNMFMKSMKIFEKLNSQLQTLTPKNTYYYNTPKHSLKTLQNILVLTSKHNLVLLNFSRSINFSVHLTQLPRLKPNHA